MSTAAASGTDVGSLLDQLKGVATCEVSDALVKLGVKHGGLLTDMRMFSPQAERGTAKIIGPAWTVKMVHPNDPSPSPDRHFVDAAPRGSVMLIQAPPGVKSANWGGLMSLGAISRGLVGTVIDGGCRDLTEHWELGYPVFARHNSTLGASPFTRPAALSVPLTITPLGPPSDQPFPAVTVHPGDIIMADVDGVIAIPSGLLKEAVEGAIKQRDTDLAIAKEIRGGMGVADAFKKFRM